MGTISDKLTYLNDTKGLLKDSINSLGGEITSQTTFRNYATELDSIYSRLPKVTGTGSNVTLTPTLKGRLSSVINGDTEQEGTPTPDNPKEIKSVTGLQKVSVEGKNLLDTQYFENGSIDGTTGQNVSAPYNARGNNYISVIPNTTYTISSNATLTNLRLSEYTNTKTNIQRDVISNNNKLTITTTANTYYLRWSLNYNNSTEITQQIIDSLDLQLEQGSTATDYEPYQSQEYDINLGKNLLPFTNQDFTFKDMHYYVQNGNIYLNGTNAGETGSNNALFKENFSFYLEAGTYTLQDKGLVSGNRDIRKYSDNTVLGRLNPNSKVVSFTLTERTQVYLGFYIYNQTYNNELIEVQLEKGSQATSYSPYFAPIELNKIGDYQDYITGTIDNWSIKRQIGSVVLDGTETGWDKLSGVAYNTYIIDNLITANRTNDTAPYLSNYFTAITNNQRYLNNSFFINSNNRILISYDDITTTANFKTWLSTHNTKVVYELATPTTEPITNTELIEDLNNFYNAKSYNGQTNISVEGDLPMILDVSAIKGE